MVQRLLPNAQADALLALEPEITAKIVRRSVGIKAQIVSQDEKETTGLRIILNYGHTVGHALEASTAYDSYLHGEAVAVGMVAAAEIGRRMGITSEDIIKEQNDLLSRFGLPTKCPGIDLDAVMAAMSLDKKTSGRAIKWVLLEEIGRTVLRDDVPIALVEEVVRSLAK